jgi:hypothetical protein
VCAQLEGLAAQGELIAQDDTPVRIVARLEENQQAQAQAEALGLARSKVRTGMSTTALVVKGGEPTMDLSSSGRSHAGEHLKALLAKRAAEHGTPLVMSEALASHAADETPLMRCHCLAHGRRKGSALEEVFPEEGTVVIDALTQVFDHEDEARGQQMRAEERLAYHQAYSGPIMDGLTCWLEQQVEDRLVAPNGSLGKAIASLLGHWETLTRFFSVPGAPRDNNTVERALKRCIRQRQNALFSATAHRASLASLLTSLMATCIHAGVNALESLVALQEHRAEVWGEPAAWLPWNSYTHGLPPEAHWRQSSAIWACAG